MPEFSGEVMGTSYTVKIQQLPLRKSKEEMAEEVRLLLDSINNSMSTYLPESEVSRLNRLAVGEWTQASSGFFNVLRFGLDLCEYTDGAFDPSVGPLVDLWGFGAADFEANIPGDAVVKKTLEQVGCGGIELNDEKRKIRKTRELQIDLSAIAKGYAVDIVSNALIFMRVRSFMIELGGEVFVRGYKSRYDFWKIAVECPDTQERSICHVLKVRNIGIATSGDYRNYFEQDGQRFSHTIDPITGKPVKHQLASVTVLHPSVMQADGFATAIMVMGPEKGYDFAIEEELPALFLIRDGEGFETRYTPVFERYLDVERDEEGREIQ